MIATTAHERESVLRGRVFVLMGKATWRAWDRAMYPAQHVVNHRDYRKILFEKEDENPQR